MHFGLSVGTVLWNIELPLAAWSRDCHFQTKLLTSGLSTPLWCAFGSNPCFYCLAIMNSGITSLSASVIFLSVISAILAKAVDIMEANAHCSEVRAYMNIYICIYYYYYYTIYSIQVVLFLYVLLLSLYYQDNYLSLLLLSHRFERISMIKHSSLLYTIFYSAITVESFTQTLSLKFKRHRRGLQWRQLNTEMHKEINGKKKIQTRLELCQFKCKPGS